MERTELGDLIINKKITIKEFYELACQEGIEGRILNITVQDRDGINLFTKPEYMTFGKWWTKDSAILHLKEQVLPGEGVGQVQG